MLATTTARGAAETIVPPVVLRTCCALLFGPPHTPKINFRYITGIFYLIILIPLDKKEHMCYIYPVSTHGYAQEGQVLVI
jgi:hypothetical protein